MAESANFQVDGAQTIDGAEVGSAVDEGESVRDSILAAMSEDEAPETPEVDEDTSEDVEAEAEPVEVDDDDPEPVEASDDEAEDDEPEETDEEAEPEPVEAPVSWSAEDKKVFESLPREAQEVVARRERERDQGVNKTLEEVAPLRNVAEKYTDYFANLNVKPADAFEWLVHAEATLRHGTPEQKRVQLERLAQDYGISLAPAEAPSDDDDEYVDPKVSQLSEEVAQLRGQLTSRQRAEIKEQQAKAEQQVSTFRDAKTEAGAPAHPYFADVESDMVALAQADRAAGKIPDIADLYERACWQNPSIREKLIADTKSDEQRKAMEEKRKRAAKAKKASKSVSSSSGSGAPRTADKEESVRDSIRAAMQEQAA